MDETAKPSRATVNALAASLAAYEAEMELQSIRVLAGGSRRVDLCTDFPALCRRIMQVAPHAERPLIQLVDAHRLLVARLLRPIGEPRIAVGAARHALGAALADLRVKIAGR